MKKYIILPILAASCASANAAITQTITTDTLANGLTASGSDLLNGLTATFTGYDAFGSAGEFDNLSAATDGSFGGLNNASDGTKLFELGRTGFEDGDYTVTIDLNLAGAALGYDITSVDTFTGWSDNRMDQKYTLQFSTVGSAAYADVVDVLQRQAEHALGAGSLKVTVADDGAALLGTGVDSIRFVISPEVFDHGNDLDGSVYREFDAFGVATVPEPSSAALLGLGGLALILRRRK